MSCAPWAGFIHHATGTSARSGGAGIVHGLRAQVTCPRTGRKAGAPEPTGSSAVDRIPQKTRLSRLAGLSSPAHVGQQLQGSSQEDHTDQDIEHEKH